MVSGYDSVHVRANIARLEKAIKYGNGAGDRAHLNSSPNTRSQRSLRRPVLLTEVGIQTSIDLQTSIAPAQVHQVLKPDAKGHEDTLNADDLAAILRWSKDISSDINLSSGSCATHP
ncbi:hypothetical protein C0989_012045 [Termitomyces sp. Mn162]|nr:hypothetical protein C0989_012045 [Termitomyces sp. Mn162]